MLIKFKNGNRIEVIESSQSIRNTPKKPDMSDIDWFCDFMGFKIFPWQKVFLWLWCRDSIRNMRTTIEYAHDYYAKE